MHRSPARLIEAVVDASIAAGASLVTGGRAVDRPGFYFPPTILDCDDVAASATTTELFGPVLTVVSFDTEDEAVALANGTPFGLASGVFTQNLTRAHRMIKRIPAGVVWVNTYSRRLADRAVRRLRPVRPRPRRRPGRGARLHPHQDGLAADLRRSDPRSLRDALTSPAGRFPPPEHAHRCRPGRARTCRHLCHRQRDPRQPTGSARLVPPSDQRARALLPAEPRSSLSSEAG